MHVGEVGVWVCCVWIEVLFVVLHIGVHCVVLVFDCDFDLVCVGVVDGVLQCFLDDLVNGCFDFVRGLCVGYVDDGVDVEFGALGGPLG